jgi:F-type H+-transporting ATPase subunit b
MELLTPSYGLIFWMLVWFGIMFFLLKKFAWPIILNALQERERSIAEALDAARNAKEEMVRLKSDNEKNIGRSTQPTRCLIKRSA